MRKIILTSVALLFLSACGKSSHKSGKNDVGYKPTEFIRSFDAKKLADAKWMVSSHSEEHLYYGGREGSFKEGKVTFVTKAPDSPQFSISQLKASLGAAPGFVENGELILGQEYHAAYGESDQYIGSITTQVLPSEAGVELSYKITETRK